MYSSDLSRIAVSLLGALALSVTCIAAAVAPVNAAVSTISAPAR